MCSGNDPSDWFDEANWMDISPVPAEKQIELEDKNKIVSVGFCYRRCASHVCACTADRETGDQTSFPLTEFPKTNQFLASRIGGRNANYQLERSEWDAKKADAARVVCGWQRGQRLRRHALCRLFLTARFSTFTSSLPAATLIRSFQAAASAPQPPP